MKTALIIGATGLVGSKLLQQLADEPQFEKIVAVTRLAVAYESAKVLNAVIDFDDLDKQRGVFTGDVLLSCLGTTKKQAGSYEKQRTVDFEYQFKVAKLAATNGVKHYILISSAGADASSKSPYLKMKGELEEAVLSLPFERICILQPSLLLGDRDHFRLGETLGSWVLPILCKLPFLKRYRPISGDDVASKMVAVNLSEMDSENSKEVFKLDEVFE